MLGSPLTHPPSDGVTSLTFSTTSDTLLASSWDGSIRLYDAARDQVRESYTQGSPVLSATLQNDSTAFLGTLDGAVRMYDFLGSADSFIGKHDKGVRTVMWLHGKSVALSGSWDATLRLWDARLPQGKTCVGHVAVPGKVFTMSQSDTRVVVGTSTRRVLIYDTRMIESGIPEQDRESSLKYQTRCIACSPDGTGYALSSVEGRVAVEFFDPDEASQAKKYAFRCHRKADGGEASIYPVNAIAFHPTHGTFATAGGDGVVNIWDGVNKKRVLQIATYPTSIAALAFSHDGRLLAVASSYTFELGEKDVAPDAIYVRQMSEAETLPKARN